MRVAVVEQEVTRHVGYEYYATYVMVKVRNNILGSSGK